MRRVAQDHSGQIKKTPTGLVPDLGHQLDEVCSVHGADQPAFAAAPSPALGHPSPLTEERLRICTRLLANARRDALALASYEMGDDPWSVGCRAFAFGRHRPERAASSGDYP
jgi:hypothetical protein